jgi:hypothetical protein
MSTSNLNILFSSWDEVIGTIELNTYTENGMSAFSSTGSACLDFFSSVVRDTPPDKVVELFKLAYLENPSIALKCLFNLRDCIGNGKQEKRVSFDALHYLSIWKPRTYLKNLKGFVDYGCFKDLLVLNSMGQHSLMYNPELQLMAAMLRDDFNKLSAATAAGTPNISISLVAKWAPTEGCSFDKRFGSARILAELCGWNKRTYRKNISFLRKHLDILERHESLNEWELIDFQKVPSVAMKKQKKAFERHLPNQFHVYLEAVMAGKAKMNSKGVQPHELVRTYLHGNHVIDQAVDAQWNALLTRLKSVGLFKDAVAVCDVSGSMSGVPMEVSIALGILVSELSAPPFNNKIITFSATPAWHNIVGDNLSDKVNNLSKAAWGMNTDFIAVFNMLLTEAKAYRLTPEQMIKKIFVFTDMQFDTATNAQKYQSAFKVVKTMYDTAGYKVPQIIFWNLRDTKSSFPVRKDTPGVALMSGFSAEMLKLFLDDEEITPYSMMLKAIQGYEVFVVDGE